MRRFLFCFLFLFTLFSFMIFIWVRQNTTGTMLGNYQQKMPFSEREMAYQSVTRSLADNGLVFYQPTFPTLPLTIKTERMNLQTLPNETVIRLSDITLDVAQTLLNRDGDTLAETLAQFEAPHDFLLKPLETMAILNQDVVKGTIEIRIRYIGEVQELTLTVERKEGKVLTAKTTLIGNTEKGLWRFIDALFQHIHVEITDRKLLNAIAGYYTAINTPIPPKLKKTLQTGSLFKADVDLNQPWPISKLLTRF